MNLLIPEMVALWIALACPGSSAFHIPRVWARTTVKTPRSDAPKDHTLDKDANEKLSRRQWLTLGIGSSLVSTSTGMPFAAQARYVLDEQTGDYVEVEDVDWQTVWKERLDKASSMSKEEIFTAARGAGNRPTDSSEESPASRKRRALSNCRSATARKAANVADEKECTARVLGGETEFILHTGPVSSIATPWKKTEGKLLTRMDALHLGILAIGACMAVPMTAQAAEEKTIYLSGKPPKVPGTKPKDKNDLTGTRKDPNFLRSIADCKSQCESKGKAKEDCLSECQDICCTTYEQCTFNIVPRI